MKREKEREEVVVVEEERSGPDIRRIHRLNLRYAKPIKSDAK